MREIHIYLGDKIPYLVSPTLKSTYDVIKDPSIKVVNTTQPHFCSTRYLIDGFRLFVHMIDEEIVEMKLGYIEGCSKEIRVEHNLEKMLMANKFGLARPVNEDDL